MRLYGYEVIRHDLEILRRLACIINIFAPHNRKTSQPHNRITVKPHNRKTS